MFWLETLWQCFIPNDLVTVFEKVMSSVISKPLVGVLINLIKNIMNDNQEKIYWLDNVLSQ